MKKMITLVEAFQKNLISQFVYTQVHRDVTTYITNSTDRLLAWYEVDACSLIELEEAYIKRQSLTGKQAEKSKTYCSIFDIMDMESERI